MKIEIDRTGTLPALANILTKLDDEAGVASMLVFACDENGYNEVALNPVLQGLSKPCFGGVFPEILAGKEKLSKGVVVIGLQAEVEIEIAERLGDSDTDFDAMLHNAFPNFSGNQSSMFVFVDGLSSGIGGLIDALFNQFGLGINYIGGGAGSLTLKAKPCIITNKGLLQDSAVMALVHLNSGIGVAHGWQQISNAFKVTEAQGNRIVSLDWRPAFEVYREVVEEHGNISFSNASFFDIAKAYPFGIAKLDAEMVVRDPLMVEGSELICVGEVPQGAYVHILHGGQETLIQAATEASRLAKADFSDTDPGLMIFIDCISRVLFLGDDFHREVDAVVEQDLPMFGALTLGEIANNGREYLEFFNKTSVIGLFP